MIKYLFSSYLLNNSYDLNKIIIKVLKIQLVIEIFLFDENKIFLFIKCKKKMHSHKLN